jgi:putative intracellular protease/amidase
MTKSIVVYLPDGFNDWEGAFLLPLLRQVQRAMIIVSETGSPVSSIGGLKTQVNAELGAISLNDIEALVLIGSDSWLLADHNKKAISVALDLFNRGSLVCAICAATVALARTGLLETRKHTSNDLDLLKSLVPSYQGKENYVDMLAVTDGNLITASGMGALEFTLEIMRSLNIYPEEKRRQWYSLYKEGIKPPAEFWSS